MAAATKLLRKAGNIHPSAGTKTDFDAAAWLLHEEQTHFNTGHAAGVVYQVFGILGRSTRGVVIAAANLRVSHSSPIRCLQTLQHPARELQRGSVLSSNKRS